MREVVSDDERSKEEWFCTFLELPNGIPSHDTFGDVFARLDPEEFQRCFMEWNQGVAELMPGEVVAIDGKTGITVQPRYFISRLDFSTEQLLASVLAHWSIENSLHWSLDVAFREDHSLVRQDHGPQNLATLRNISRNMLKRETSLKVGIQGKRLQAGWREDYLPKVLLS